MSEKAKQLTNTNRHFYINKNGELYVQFKPKYVDEIPRFRYLAMTAEKVTYTEKLKSGHTISGVVTNVTKTGIMLKDWSITYGN